MDSESNLAQAIFAAGSQSVPTIVVTSMAAAIPAAPAVAVVMAVVTVVVVVAPAPVQQVAAAARGNECIFRFSFLGGSVVCTGQTRCLTC